MLQISVGVGPVERAPLTIPWPPTKRRSMYACSQNPTPPTCGYRRVQRKEEEEEEEEVAAATTADE